MKYLKNIIKCDVCNKESEDSDSMEVVEVPVRGINAEGYPIYKDFKQLDLCESCRDKFWLNSINGFADITKSMDSNGIENGIDTDKTIIRDGIFTEDDIKNFKEINELCIKYISEDIDGEDKTEHEELAKDIISKTSLTLSYILTRFEDSDTSNEERR